MLDTSTVLYAAMAMGFIEAHRHEAAAIYVKIDRSSMKREFIEGLLNDPANRFAVEPLRMLNYAELMARTGALRQAPRDWKEDLSTAGPWFRTDESGRRSRCCGYVLPPFGPGGA